MKRAKDLTKESEGLKLQAYQDPGGIWTIGYGQTGSFVHEGLTCTKEEAEHWLNTEYDRIQQQINSVVTVPLNENQLGALCDFVYNLGIGQLKNSTLLKLLNQGDYNGACNQFSRWVYQGKIELPGLVTRRRREQQLWNTGNWN